MNTLVIEHVCCERLLLPVTIWQTSICEMHQNCLFFLSGPRTLNSVISIKELRQHGQTFWSSPVTLLCLFKTQDICMKLSSAMTVVEDMHFVIIYPLYCCNLLDGYITVLCVSIYSILCVLHRLINISDCSFWVRGVASTYLAFSHVLISMLMWEWACVFAFQGERAKGDWESMWTC